MPFTPGWNRALRDARIEDLAWMVETGENGHGAARRLNMRHDALEKWTQRHAPELWRKLSARDPRDVNYRSDAPGGLYRRAS